MSHGHNHPQCEACWIAARSELVGGSFHVRRPTTLKDTYLETCCWCGHLTIVGIFVRSMDAGLLCREDA